MVDAHTGKSVYEYDLYRDSEIRGTVRIPTWQLPWNGDMNALPDITPYCRDLTVNVSGVGSVNTNSSGYYIITVPSPGNYTVTSGLDGPHCYVTTEEWIPASHTYSASTSSLIITNILFSII
jgi:hypothetical protein